MHTPEIFTDLLIIFLVSVPVAFVCLRLKLPLLVGLMVTGIVIGPYGLGLIKGLEAIEILAEIGVVLLLFTIGLEFSLGRLREMKRLVLVGGGLQVILTIAATTFVSMLFGRSLNQSIFFGFLVALSSTAIVLKSYVDRDEMNAPHGRAGIGILLFQDISIVLMMLFVPVLGGKDTSTAGEIALQLGTSIAGLLVIIIGAWFLVPVLLKHVVRLKSPEVFLLTVVLLALGTAWITSQFGLSLAIGAFIAGMVLADSDFSHQITSEILPFRDVFNSIFFVSIGLLLSIGALIANIQTVLVWVVLLFFGKVLIIWAVVKILRFPHRVAATTAIGLAQIGEFSFVLAKAGKGVDLLPDSDYQSFLAASIISMIATPFLIAGAPKFGYFVQSKLSDGKPEELDNDPQEDVHVTSSGGLNNHVIVCGYGLNGRNLVRVLRAVLVPYTILEMNAEVVRDAKEKGEKINFGDATRREVLKHAEIEKASAIVFAISDPQATRRAVTNARELSGDIFIIVRTRYITEINELLELGADEVIPEEFETSIEIFSRVLQRYGVARNVIDAQTVKIRGQAYMMLRSPAMTPQIKMANLNAALHAATTETLKLEEDCFAIGKTLVELDLRDKTDVTVIAVLRGETIHVNPGTAQKLEENDTLILLGESEKIEKAVKYLRQSPGAGELSAQPQKSSVP